MDFHATSEGGLLVNILKFTQGIFDVYCQSKNMAGLHTAVFKKVAIFNIDFASRDVNQTH